jgi:hypothetical protein
MKKLRYGKRHPIEHACPTVAPLQTNDLKQHAHASPLAEIVFDHAHIAAYLGRSALGELVTVMQYDLIRPF